MTTLRLLLGDQLNPSHPWFRTCANDVVYVMMEVRQETDYVLHHAQKILAIFAAMRDFSAQLKREGHRVHYLTIDAPDNEHAIPANLDRLIALYKATRLEYQEPDEWRLDRQLADYVNRLPISAGSVDTDHFYTTRNEVARHFGSRRHWTMESFYRHMRHKHGVLLEADGKPAGGKWNYDHQNRRPWSGTPPEPDDARPTHDHRHLWETIQRAGVKSFGEPSANALCWPANRAEALQQLELFLTQALPHFGTYQDAMSTRAPRLFHSLISFALNTKMLSPKEVVARVEAAWRSGMVPLHAAEGFIRQILGWREYVRGVYWARMPGYAESNALGHHTDLPSWFWNGRTRMQCLKQAITQSLVDAYAHHIQRLMIIGNFSLLAGLAPDQVHRWYLGVYIDAFEWVEMPNTLGMSQFADGGFLATKPYVSSGAYIHRMSDYCRGCFYDHDDRLGVSACPFNALYWQFFMRNEKTLHTHGRLSMVYRQLARMPDRQKQALADRAELTLSQLETI